jgi:cytochrome c peroxidase
LRNVAVRRAFFHNAVFTDLRDTLAFYATRDTDPKRWYGTLTQWGGVPKSLRANVNRDEVPYGQRAGEQPRLNEQDIDDLLAFLTTLTDADLVPRSASPAGSVAAANAVVRGAQRVASPMVAANR